MKKGLWIAGLVAAMLLTGCGSNGTEKTTAETDSTAQTTETTAAEPTEEQTPEATEKVTESATPDQTKVSTPDETRKTTPAVTEEPTAETTVTEEVNMDPVPISFDTNWEFAENSAIHTGQAVLYKASENRKDKVIGVNAGHGTSGGESVRTNCHPDGTAKITGGSTAEGATTAMAVASGMTFLDGTPERDVTLAEALILKDLLLENGYDVLMIRESDDVQLDNIARSVICNNNADCHIAIHWDGDGLDYDKGCFYMAVADGIKGMYPTSTIWEEDNRLGDCLISGLSGAGCSIFEGGSMQMDLTQTSYSSIPTTDIELGNAASDHSDATLQQLAQGLLAGINQYYGF